MSGYAGRHRDALTGAPVAAAPDRRRRRAILLAAVAVAVVVAGLFAIPVLSRLDGGAGTDLSDGAAGGRPAAARPAGGPGRPGRAATEVGPGVTTTTTPDGQPTDSATTTTSPSDVSERRDEPRGARRRAPPGRRDPRPPRRGRSHRTRTQQHEHAAPPPRPPSPTRGRSAKAMFPAFGFADSEFGCLNAMWNRLDRWGSVAQVRPGLAYVKSRYGTPVPRGTTSGRPASTDAGPRSRATAPVRFASSAGSGTV